MHYKCGHKGCDICGARECAGVKLKHYLIRDVVYSACGFCIKKAIKFAVNAAEEFSTIVDLDKPCGK